MAKPAIAAGADALIIEVHETPSMPSATTTIACGFRAVDRSVPADAEAVRSMHLSVVRGQLSEYKQALSSPTGQFVPAGVPTCVVRKRSATSLWCSGSLLDSSAKGGEHGERDEEGRCACHRICHSGGMGLSCRFSSAALARRRTTFA